MTRLIRSRRSLPSRAVRDMHQSVALLDGQGQRFDCQRGASPRVGQHQNSLQRAVGFLRQECVGIDERADRGGCPFSGDQLQCLKFGGCLREPAPAVHEGGGFDGRTTTISTRAFRKVRDVRGALRSPAPSRAPVSNEYDASSTITNGARLVGGRELRRSGATRYG